MNFNTSFKNFQKKNNYIIMKITFFMQLSWNKVTFIATVIGISFFVSEKTRNVYCCSHYFLSVCIHKVAFFFKRQKTWKKKKNTWIINAKSLGNLFYYWNLPCDTFIDIHFFVEIVYLFMGIIYAILSAFNFGVLFCIFHQIYLFFSFGSPVKIKHFNFCI